MPKQKQLRYRMAALLLAILLCFSSLVTPAAFALEVEGQEPSVTETEEPAEKEEEPLQEEDPQEQKPEQEPDAQETQPEEPESQESEETAETPAQTFVNAVEALDREAILAAVNRWALASRDWRENKDDPDLTAALEDATAASDEAAAPVYAAEDLYMTLSEEEQQTEPVAAAYAALAALVLSMQQATEVPVEPDQEPEPESGDKPPELNEIAQMLYGDLPDAPTGSYLGSYGLPVATGDTKIGLGLWSEDPETTGYLDAELLNGDDQTITVPREAGQDYAVVPITMQVEYPANGSTSELVLPEGGSCCWTMTSTSPRKNWPPSC